MKIWLGILIGVAFTAVGEVTKYMLNMRKQIRLMKQDVRDPIEADGHYVQVDCSECGKMNRIAAANVRKRPICGGCKSRLLPKRRISIYRVKSLPFDRILDASLTKEVILDYDKFWATLDAHFKKKGAIKNEPIDAKDLPN